MFLKEKLKNGIREVFSQITAKEFKIIEFMIL